VTLAFVEDAYLTAGYAGPGNLVAVGTELNPITFTSIQSAPAAGDWSGLIVGQYCDDATTTFEHVTIEYGGDNGYANLWWYYCEGSIADSDTTNSSTWGMYRTGADPSITDVSYDDNASGDLR